MSTTEMLEVRPRKRRPSPVEERRLQAEAGDVDALWLTLTGCEPACMDQEDAFLRLLQALEVRAGQDPAALSAQMFGRMMAFGGYLWFRAAHAIRRLCAAADRKSDGSPAIPREVTEHHLPLLFQLQAHLAELAQAEASTTRLWELARRRKRGADTPSPPQAWTVARDLIACGTDGGALVLSEKVETIELPDRTVTPPCESALEQEEV
jgi:hypothetical protein